MKQAIFSFFRNSESAIRRFPLSILILFVLEGYCEYYNWFMEFGDKNNFSLTFFFACVLTFIASIGTQLLYESIVYNRNNITKNILIRTIFFIIPLVYGTIFFYNYDVILSTFASFPIFSAIHRNINILFLNVFGLLSFVCIAPFITSCFSKKHNIIGYFNYFARIFFVIFASFFVASILIILGNIAFFAIDALFGLHIDTKVIWTLVIFSTIIAGLFYSLVQIPKQSILSDTTFNKDTFLFFFLKWIAVPFFIVYFVILYAYSIKVLAHFHEWPKGIISWLVIVFSLFGYFCYIFSFPYQDESKYLTIFRKYFPAFVLPQVAILFYAIYLRIAQYGFTASRYYVVVFGIILTITSFYFLVSQKKKLIFLPTTIAIAILIISVGPWSVFSYPVHDQYERLKTLLRQHNLLEANGNTIIKKETPLKNISPEEREDIQSRIYYICRYSDCSQIKSLFKNYYDTDKYSELVSTQMLNDIHKFLFGTEKYEATIEYDPENLGIEANVFPIDTTKYDYFFPIFHPRYKEPGLSPARNNFPAIRFDYDKKAFAYHKDFIINNDTSDVIFFPFDYKKTFKNERGIYQFENEEVLIDIILINGSVNIEKNTQTNTETVRFYGIEGYAFIKIKK